MSSCHLDFAPHKISRPWLCLILISFRGVEDSRCVNQPENCITNSTPIESYITSLYSLIWNLLANHLSFPSPTFSLIKTVEILTVSSLIRGANNNYNKHAVKMLTVLIGKAYWHCQISIQMNQQIYIIQNSSVRYNHCKFV